LVPSTRWTSHGRAPQHPLPHRARSTKTLHHVVVTDDPITVSDDDDGLAAALSDRINEFNTDATGFDDGRLLRAAQRGRDGSLEAGLAGWTWGGCGYIEFLWVRTDLRGAGLGSRLLAAAEAESRARGCAQMVVSSHSFRLPTSTVDPATSSTGGLRAARGAIPTFTWSRTCGPGRCRSGC
jgi:GNAT superfamily N-acetyltransferase